MSDDTLIKAARKLVEISVTDERVGRRASDKWRHRLNQALTVLCVGCIVALAFGCEALRATLMGLIA